MVNNVAPDHVSIGAIAEAAGVTVATIRYYEQMELVEPACRVGGKRRFTADTTGRVNFIRRAQQVGFNLVEIKAILDDKDRRWPDLVKAKIAALEQRRTELDSMIEVLAEIGSCGCSAVSACGRLDEF